MTAVRPLSCAELATVLDWAAAEGWNPGLDDAPAFHAADPDGFLGAFEEHEPVAAVSVVRHAPGVGFLGLYLCRPDRRGRGLGWAVWSAGLARMEGVALGLDGVPAQQANYARQGFRLSHGNARWTGEIEGAADPAVVPLTEALATEAAMLDAAVSGYGRARWLGAWLAGAPTRRAAALLRDGRLAGFGAIRACRSGFKIGPLVAPDRGGATALVRALALGTEGAPVSIDAPSPNAAATAMARELGLAPAFETARMWRGPGPAEDLSRLYGVGTLELG